MINTRHSLQSGARDIFGWGRYSWIFLPVGILVILRKWKAWLVASIFPSLVLFHLAYWVGSALFGPRYYYEGLFSITLLTAAAVVFLAGWPVFTSQKHPEKEPEEEREADPAVKAEPDNPGKGSAVTLRERMLSGIRRVSDWRPPPPADRAISTFKRTRPWLAAALVAGLVGWNMAAYLPDRLNGMYGLYEISKKDQEPFLTEQAQELTPALIIVHSPRWMHYGALLDLQDPFLTTPFIFIWSRGPMADAAAAESYPERNIYHYYVDEPYSFYTSPRQE